MSKYKIIFLFVVIFVLSLAGVYAYGQTTGVSHHPLEIQCKDEFCIKTSGVGIGKKNPGAKLDVSATGNGAELLRLSTERAWVFRQTNTGASSELDLHSLVSNKNFKITSLGGNRVAQFRVSDTASSNRVLLAPDGGRIGIGTTSPSQKLHVAGNILGNNLSTAGSVTGAIFYDNNNTDYYVDPASTSALRHLRVGEDGGWTALYLYGRDRWMLNAHNGGNLNVRRWNGSNWNQHVLSLTPAGNANFQGYIHAGDEIKSTNKSQYKNIHIDRLTEKHEKCTHSVLYNQTNLLYCNAACSRYCQDRNYSGGTVSEYNNDTHYAGCICIP